MHGCVLQCVTSALGKTLQEEILLTADVESQQQCSNSLSIPIYGLSGYSFVCSQGKADLVSQSKAVRRPFLKGCTAPAQTSKTKIEREF